MDACSATRLGGHVRVAVVAFEGIFHQAEAHLEVGRVVVACYDVLCIPVVQWGKMGNSVQYRYALFTSLPNSDSIFGSFTGSSSSFSENSMAEAARLYRRPRPIRVAAEELLPQPRGPFSQNP